jgi:hypothetical protein
MYHARHNASSSDFSTYLAKTLTVRLIDGRKGTSRYHYEPTAHQPPGSTCVDR